MADLQQAEELSRAAALREISTLDDMRRLLLEQHSHSYKWITASLLAINGGAAVTILGQENLDPIWKVIAGGCFAIGILLALSVAVASQKINILALVPIQRQIGYWLTVSVDGHRLDDLECSLQNELRASAKFAWIVPGLGWLSALTFVLGLSAIAFPLLNQRNGELDGKSTRVSSDCSHAHAR